MLLDPYHRRASECLQFAETCNDADDGTIWRELALCWLRLSDHADRLRCHAGRSDPLPRGVQVSA
jgi:hypothetical protein